MSLRRRSSPIIIALSAVAILYFVIFYATRYHVGPATFHFGVGKGSCSSSLGDIYNNSLGFESIFVVGLPSRTDRRDGMALGAALSNLKIEFVDGIIGDKVPDKAIPATHPEHKRPLDPVVGSWRAHLNAIQEVVRRNLSSALILEDDADWDIRIRDQLYDFALSTHALTQPLSGYDQSYADQTYLSPTDNAPEVSEFSLESLPATVPPKTSPYGDNWDLLWLGHCGMRFPFHDNKVIPKGRVSWYDPTVPQQQYLWTISRPDELREQYLNHTRVVHHEQEAACSLGYAITQKAARQLLYEIGLKEFNAAFDIILRWFCEGREGRRYHNCLTMQPSLFQHHRPAGSRSAESDIADHGEGFRETAHTNVLRWSVRMNAEVLMEGGTNFVDQYPDV